MKTQFIISSHLTSIENQDPLPIPCSRYRHSLPQTPGFEAQELFGLDPLHRSLFLFNHQVLTFSSPFTTMFTGSLLFRSPCSCPHGGPGHPRSPMALSSLQDPSTPLQMNLSEASLFKVSLCCPKHLQRLFISFHIKSLLLCHFSTFRMTPNALFFPPYTHRLAYHTHTTHSDEARCSTVSEQTATQFVQSLLWNVLPTPLLIQSIFPDLV